MLIPLSRPLPWHEFVLSWRPAKHFVNNWKSLCRADTRLNGLENERFKIDATAVSCRGSLRQLAWATSDGSEER
jgi:hypothetical protein